MPLRSQAQRAFMHIHHPRIARRWERETLRGKLPKHVRDDLRAAIDEFTSLYGISIAEASAILEVGRESSIARDATSVPLLGPSHRTGAG
jgi:hypothetical protein